MSRRRRWLRSGSDKRALGIPGQTLAPALHSGQHQHPTGAPSNPGAAAWGCPAPWGVMILTQLLPCRGSAGLAVHAWAQPPLDPAGLSASALPGGSELHRPFARLQSVSLEQSSAYDAALLLPGLSPGTSHQHQHLNKSKRRSAMKKCL